MLEGEKLLVARETNRFRILRVEGLTSYNAECKTICVCLATLAALLSLFTSAASIRLVLGIKGLLCCFARL